MFLFRISITSVGQIPSFCCGGAEYILTVSGGKNGKLHVKFVCQITTLVATLDWFQMTLSKQSITTPSKLIVLKQLSQTILEMQYEDFHPY